MKEKFIPFVSGFLGTLIIIALASWYFAKPGKVDQPKINVVDEESLYQLRQVISTLNNYGDLPKDVDTNSMGKANPFE